MTSMATQIDIELADAPAALPQATEALAEAQINVLGFSLETRGSMKTARFVTDDAKGALGALDSVGITRRTREVLLLAVDHDPGELDQITRRLAKVGVNLESGFAVMAPDGQLNLAIGVDEPGAARKVLGE